MSYVETIVTLVPADGHKDPWSGEVETVLDERNLTVEQAVERAQDLARKHNMRAQRVRQERKAETWLDTLFEGIGTLALVALVILAL